jgi:hypothetical protein
MKLRLLSPRLDVRAIVAVLALLPCFSATALSANEITGSVHNPTRGQTAAGDTVILLSLDREMREQAHATTNAQGTFRLKVQFPDKLYLVRVVHQGVSYDQRGRAGDIVSIDVFDAARKVQGITGSIEILRAGMMGRMLHVSDMYEIKNESSPPITQVGERTFEVYLPADAKIDSVLAAGPGKIGAMISSALAYGEPGHYTVNFPLRPGATKFAFNYDLPYDGHAAFQTRRVYPLQQFAVMIPPAMQFSSRSQAFEILPTGNKNYRVHAAKGIKAGEGPAFEVSGSGAFPSLGDQAKSSTPFTASVPGPAVSAGDPANLPSPASFDSRSQNAQSSSQSLVLGVLSIVTLVSCGAMVWRARKRRHASGAQTVVAGGTQNPKPTSLLEGLKKEMLQLEADRLRGSICGAEYLSTKRAWEKTSQRSLGKAG